MTTTIDGVKTIQIRKAKNGDFDLNLARVCDCSYLENAILNAYPTESESGNPIYFDDGADNIPVKELIVNLEPKQSGSGDPSPTNVRPITGFDGVMVKRTGKNLYRSNKSSYTYHGITYTFNSDGSVTFSGTATEASDIVLFGDDTLNLPTGSYIFSGMSGGSSSTYGLALRIRNNSTSTNRYVNCYSGETTFAMADGEVINRVYVVVKSGVTISMTVYPMIRVAGSSPYYSKYNGTSYPVTFPSEVGTVYGGSLNVTTGVLTVDRYGLDLGTIDYGTGTDSVGQYFRLLNMSPVAVHSLTDNFCSCYKMCLSTNVIDGGIATSVSGTNLYIRDTRYTTASELKSALSGQIFCYKLATPQTYQLTPTEVSTLLGSNTIQSDGSMGLKYRADINKIIERLENA